MVVLFTDFGWQGPYVGQLKIALSSLVSIDSIVDLAHDAPQFSPINAGVLLEAWSRNSPFGAVFLAVVDPGVGSDRQAVAVCADQRWYVGPANGLFDAVAASAKDVRVYPILWRPESLSRSFHARDLFAPIAARLALYGRCPAGWLGDAEDYLPQPGLKHQFQVIYLDAYGNAITNVKPGDVLDGQSLVIGDRTLPWGNTFASVPPGEPLCYWNSSGLLELAVNQGSAAEYFGMRPGFKLSIA